MYPHERRWNELIFFSFNNRLNRFLQANQYYAGRSFLVSHRELLTSDAYIHFTAFLNRHRAIDFHNRFAAAWNRRDFDTAERILNEGLIEFPDDPQLLQNLETINRNRR
jgi:hypothetical protein